MVLFSQTVKPPRRFTWDVSVDPCPYFDNYKKFLAEKDTAYRFVRSNVPVEKPVVVEKPKAKPAVSNTEWVAE